MKKTQVFRLTQRTTCGNIVEVSLRLQAFVGQPKDRVLK
jgi:hypothetical protein